MISITMPDGEVMTFEQVVFDYNGTLAADGIISPAIRKLLTELANQVTVTIITADTFGLARSQLAGLDTVELIILEPGMGGKEKARHVQQAGSATTVVVGNGNNDQAMFQVAGLSICVLGPEGANTAALYASKIVVRSPEDAIGLLLHPQRLVATLRN
ncbi:MAG TPA: ATPase P [Patescibacteria group bacterium]|nr:ATPase P [Patescibacteria group bacterium]